ncbi:lipase [Brucella sp. BE17]|uniref:lipase n=1 Tax=Brucella sp. BE17 TaxID=3142977 RepID=UPI0031B9EF07
MNQSVQRRAVFFIGGYDPKTPEAFFSRLSKEISRFDTVWSTKSVVLPVKENPDNNIGCALIETDCESEGWKTTTDFNFLALDSIVLSDFSRPLAVRLGKYLLAFGDFIVSGPAFQFFAHAWRFGLYFLYPFLTLVLFALASIGVGRLLSPWLGLFSPLVGLGVFALALAVLGKKWPINHLMDLWSFSLNFMRGRRPDAEALMQHFAQTIVRRVGEGRYDEVILIGHSTGGMLMLDVAARCIALDGAFSTRASNVSVLTLGSTALKAGYHPAAQNFRDGVQRLTDDGRFEWVEIQCLTDVINFYKTDPVAEMKLQRAKGRDFPIVRTVRIRDMLQPETYKRVKRNLFRVHYQYVFGNTKRYWYDFFQVCCGPISLVDRAKNQIMGGLPSKEGIAE